MSRRGGRRRGKATGHASDEPAAAEIGLDHLRVAADNIRPAVGNEDAVIEDDDPLRQLRDERHVVLDEQDGISCRGKRANELDQRPLLDSFRSGARLVEQQRVGTVASTRAMASSRR